MIPIFNASESEWSPTFGASFRYKVRVFVNGGKGSNSFGGRKTFAYKPNELAAKRGVC